MLAITPATGTKLAELGFLLILIAGVWLVSSENPALRGHRARTVVAGAALAVAGGRPQRLHPPKPRGGGGAGLDLGNGPRYGDQVTRARPPSRSRRTDCPWAATSKIAWATIFKLETGIVKQRKGKQRRAVGFRRHCGRRHSGAQRPSSASREPSRNPHHVPGRAANLLRGLAELELAEGIPTTE